MRLDSFLLALSTFFATIGPADLVLVFAALIIAANTLVDIAYVWLDPRIRYRQEG